MRRSSSQPAVGQARARPSGLLRSLEDKRVSASASRLEALGPLQSSHSDLRWGQTGSGGPLATDPQHDVVAKALVSSWTRRPRCRWTSDRTDGASPPDPPRGGRASPPDPPEGDGQARPQAARKDAGSRVSSLFRGRSPFVTRPPQLAARHRGRGLRASSTEACRTLEQRSSCARRPGRRSRRALSARAARARTRQEVLQARGKYWTTEFRITPSKSAPSTHRAGREPRPSSSRDAVEARRARAGRAPCST